MSSHIIGIVGESETTQEMVENTLADMRDAADAEGEAFWAIVGVTPKAPDAIQYAMDWFIAQGIAYDLVVDPSIADKLAEEYTNSADSVTKIKAVEKKVIDLLVENDGVHLLGLLGDGESASKQTMDQVQRFYDMGDEFQVFALDDAGSEINFGPDVEDETGVEDDFDALGAAADDEGDDAAIARLTELAEAEGIDHASFNTWAEVAELLKPAEDPAPAPAKGAAKKGAAAKAPAKPKGGANLWTEEALDDLEAKELKTIAIQAGIPGAAKLGHAALKAALLGTENKAASSPEPEAEPEKPATAKKTPAKAKAAPAAAPAEEEETGAETTLLELIEAAAAALGAIAEHIRG